MSDLNQIYAALLDIKDDVGAARADIKSIGKRSEDHEQRLGKIEKREAHMRGWAAAIGASVSAVVAIAWPIVKKDL